MVRDVSSTRSVGLNILLHICRSPTLCLQICDHRTMPKSIHQAVYELLYMEMDHLFIFIAFSFQITDIGPNKGRSIYHCKIFPSEKLTNWIFTSDVLAKLGVCCYGSVVYVPNGYFYFITASIKYFCIRKASKIRGSLKVENYWNIDMHDRATTQKLPRK